MRSCRGRNDTLLLKIKCRRVFLRSAGDETERIAGFPGQLEQADHAVELFIRLVLCFRSLSRLRFCVSRQDMRRIGIDLRYGTRLAGGLRYGFRWHIVRVHRAHTSRSGP